MRLRPIRPGWIVLATVLAVAVLAAGVWWTLRPSAGYPRAIRIATGAGDGAWAAFGGGLADLLQERFPGIEVEDVSSEGSLENALWLGVGKAELAFVQSNTTGGTNLRTIAPLYEEFLQIVVRDTPESHIDDITQLSGREVAIGPPGSGTKEVADRVRAHFGLVDMNSESMSLEAAEKAFAEHKVDAVFVFAGLPSQSVKRLLRDEEARLLSLGDYRDEGSAIDGLCISNPHFDRAVIPAHTFGTRPYRAVGTISVTALLLCREDLDKEFVYAVTGLLFRHRDGLTKIHPAVARLSEAFDPSSIRYPLHEGADAWYHRRDPSFFVRYADLMSLVFTILLAAASALLAARQWIRRRQKNRIDVYYLEIEQVARRAPGASREQLTEMRRKLERVRRRAFHDLVRERVLADESFRIFQTFLQAEVETIRNRLQELDRGSAQDARTSPSS